MNLAKGAGMAVKGVSLFQCGVLELDKSITTFRTGMGEKVRVPVLAALIETAKGFILFDTGLHPKGLEDPADTWGNHIQSLIHTFEPQHDLRFQLAEFGLVPGDIKTVISSHLHYDHTGGNLYFPESRFILQRAEYRFAGQPDPFAASPYLANHLNFDCDSLLLDGDYLLDDDIYLFFTPGHSPGHQSLVLRLPETGTVILTADAIFCQENITRQIPSGNCWNAALAAESMQRLVQFARFEKAQLVISHDPTIWDRFKP
ncbi:N-acyl homoserine lactonase family protein, partial [bacterium]|nr:N-acyl homoserine lactonase family protein [bacterium]